MSRYAIPNVDSRVPICKYARIQLWGRIEEVHSEKRLRSWLRWRDIKNTQFQSTVLTKFDEYCTEVSHAAETPAT